VAGLRGGEELVVAGAGERGVGVGGDLGAGVGLLEEGSPTPPAPSKWTYSVVKSSYVGVVSSSTALSQAHPRPSFEHYIARHAHTQCSWVKDAVGLRALRVANEHPWGAPVVELADVTKLLGGHAKPRTVSSR
jgi:hypothetical protein